MDIPVGFGEILGRLVWKNLRSVKLLDPAEQYLRFIYGYMARNSGVNATPKKGAEKMEIHIKDEGRPSLLVKSFRIIMTEPLNITTGCLLYKSLLI